MNTQLQAFLTRIQEASSQPQRELAPLLRKSSLRRVYGYVLDVLLNQREPELLKKIEGLKLHKSIRLDKKITGLARSITILKKPRQGYLLLLETKSKRADGTKTKKAARTEGTSKSLTHSWRIDQSPPKPYANLVIRLDKADLKIVDEEVKISQACQHKHVLPLLNSSKHPKKNQVSVYAKEAMLGTAEDFFKSNFYQKSSKEHQNQMALNGIKQIFEGVNHIHQKDVIHQDLKFANILVYQKKEGVRFKISDFGLAQGHLTQIRALATPSIESPEIDYAYVKYQYEKVHAGTIGYRVCFYHVGPLLNQFKAPIQLGYHKPHKANDIWALGIMMTQIFNNHFELLFSGDIDKSSIHHALIQGMLAPVRNARFDIETSMLMMNIMEKKGYFLNIIQNINSYYI